MVPTAKEQEVYFPPLERCFKDNNLLLSWQDVYTSLQDGQNELPPGVQCFLKDAESQRLLKKPLKPYDPPSSGTKSQFDHLTAAINIAPDKSATYNIMELKVDALWLSSKVKIDEVAALRIVVVEWQKRPALSLLARSWSVEDCMNSLDAMEAPTESLFTRSLINAQDGNNKGTTSEELGAKQQRRGRLLRLYYAERAYLMKTGELLLSFDFSAPKLKPSNYGSLHIVRTIVVDSYLTQEDGSAFVAQGIQALKSSLQALEELPELLESTSGDDIVLGSQITDLLLLETIALLHLIILASGESSKIISADAVRLFFQLLVDTDYLSPLINMALQGSPALGSILQLAVSLAGVAILKLSDAIEFLSIDYNDEMVLSAPEIRGYYLSSPQCLQEIHTAFTHFAARASGVAAFAMLGWSTILFNMAFFNLHNGGLESEDDEQRSVAVAQRHQWRINAINEAYSLINDNRPAEQNEALGAIAQCAVSDLRVFDLFPEIVSSLDQFWGNGMLSFFTNCCRATLFDLFRLSRPLVQYSSETLGAFLSLLGGDRSYWHFHDSIKEHKSVPADDAVAALLDTFAEWSDQIKYRYPKETAPFHRLIRALVLNSGLNDDKLNNLFEMITAADTFMIKLPDHFKAYRQAQPPDESNYDDVFYQIFADLPFFHSQRTGPEAPLVIADGRMNGGTVVDSSENCIPNGSIGTVIGDGRPPILYFTHSFSPLRYMVGCLCTAIPGNDWVETSTRSPVSIDEISDILALISTMILATQKSGSRSATAILDETFIEAEPNKNLFEIVAELFETHLELQQTNSSDTDSLEILVQCVHFFHAVALTQPSRIWPILLRSKLLEIDGNGGSLGIIVSGVEMIVGRYGFLIACIRLFEGLTESSLWSGAIIAESKAVSRFSERQALRAKAESLPHRVAATVITNFTKTLLEVFAHSRTWRYNSSDERSEISVRLSSAFNRVLHYVYGFDDETDPHRKAVVAVLADSARLITDVLLSTSSSHNVADTVLDMVSGVVPGVSSPSFIILGSMAKKEVNSAAKLCSTVASIRFARGGSLSVLEQQLFKVTPLLLRLLVGYEGFKSPLSSLMERLITTSTNSSPAPPSLLENMGTTSAKDFLVVLGYLDAPYYDVQNEIQLWKMLTAVVSSKQQWFAISLLTGALPKDWSRSLKGKSGETRKGEGNRDKDANPNSRITSLFSYAIDQLGEVTVNEARPIWKRLPSELALNMLQFVASCQNYWAWAVSALRKHPKFIEAITKDYVRHLHREPTDSVMSITTEAAIAATIAEILAMYLYSSSQVGDDEGLKSIVDHLQYYERYGVAAPKYSASLHNNLKTHLEKQHKGLKLGNFKHTLTYPTKFGSNYCYDVPFATKILDARRTEKSRELRGLEQDLAAANEDLSFVDAQIQLLTQWKLLATQLAKGVKPDTPLAAILIDVVKSCLQENARSTVPEAIFERLRFHRLELALNILQRLVVLDFKSQEQVTQLKALFSVAWDAVRTHSSNFDTVFSSQDIPYYRALLQVLFLALKPLTKPTPNAKRDPATHPPAQATELVEVLVYVVIRGFKSLTKVLHEDPAKCQPSDFVLLTALLQLMLKVPGIDLLYSQIALHFANDNTSSHATSLFSWADRFLIDGDPVYGELAILFLLEMSSIPSVAETLAVEGVLSQLASANIMQLYSRAKGMGPFDNPSRLHSIWARGILPLVLNLLDAVGSPIAAEVVHFLNSFPAQLQRLASELANRSGAVGTRPGDTHMTLGLAAEAHSTALIWLVIERYRIAATTSMGQVPSLCWDGAGVKDDVDDFVKGRSLLAPLVVPANEREMELLRLRPVGKSGVKDAGNRLEERIMAELMAASECLRGMDGV